MNDLGSPLRIFARNTISLVLREMRSRYSEQKLSYVWAVIEPLGWITMMSLIFMGVGSHKAPVGESFILFFATGLVPFSIYRDVSGAVQNAVEANKPLLYFPVIKPLDPFVARAILEFVTHGVVLFLIVAGYGFAFGGVMPEDWLNLLLPIFLLAVMGFNVGIINCVIIAHFKEWRQIWSVINKPLFFLSGVFYVADSFPPHIQAILYWNPILHCVEWVRSGFFRNFESNFASPFLVVTVTLTGLFCALAMERLYRRKILE